MSDTPAAPDLAGLPGPLRWLAEGRIVIENETVRISDVKQPQSATLNPLA